MKEKQSEAINSIYEGKVVFAWVRKIATSLLFRFDFKLGRTRAIATERSVALVVFPLVSLMVDQVCSLQAHGVCAAIRHSGNTGVSKALLATERDIAQGKLRFLLTAPGAIVGNSRWKQILLELSDSTSGSHCTVYTNVSAYSFLFLFYFFITKNYNDIVRATPLGRR